jgi:5-methylcytosine-specific restriction protein A
MDWYSGRIANAERSQIDKRIWHNIKADLETNAMEGLSAEQRHGIRLKAAWIAQKFVIGRQRSATLTCDECGLDPAHLIKGTPVRAQSLLDVHHRKPLEKGVRVTTMADLALLCPTCHRFEHSLLRANRRSGLTGGD